MARLHHSFQTSRCIRSTTFAYPVVSVLLVRMYNAFRACCRSRRASAMYRNSLFFISFCTCQIYQLTAWQLFVLSSHIAFPAVLSCFLNLLLGIRRNSLIAMDLFKIHIYLYVRKVSVDFMDNNCDRNGFDPDSED